MAKPWSNQLHSLFLFRAQVKTSKGNWCAWTTSILCKQVILQLATVLFRFLMVPILLMCASMAVPTSTAQLFQLAQSLSLVLWGSSMPTINWFHAQHKISLLMLRQREKSMWKSMATACFLETLMLLATQLLQLLLLKTTVFKISPCQELALVAQTQQNLLVMQMLLLAAPAAKTSRSTLRQAVQALV